MSRIKIEIETQQSFTYSHAFTCNQLQRLKNLVLNKGKRCIDNNYFEASETALTLFKKSKFGGPGYAMDIDKVLAEINLKLNQYC